MSITNRINKPIPPQSVELLRTRVAEILLVELSAQSTLQTDPVKQSLLEDTKVFAEIWSPLNTDQMPAVRVQMYDASYELQNHQYSRASYTFEIDILTFGVGGEEENSEQLSSERGLFLAGIIRAILSSPQWWRLGFDDGGVVERTMVSAIKRNEEGETTTTGAIMHYRLTLEVKAQECAENDDFNTLLDGVDTDLKICGTEFGYQYVSERPQSE